MQVRPRAVAVAAVACCLLPATPLVAASVHPQNGPRVAAPAGSAGARAPAVVTAVRARPHAPRLDGRLDDDAWAPASVISDFIQRDPDEGRPATERTEVRVVYTDEALYVGVRAHDSEPDRIAAQLTRRDEMSPSDWIGIAIDSYHDRRTAFEFAVNPAGVKRDTYRYDDNNEDDSWDAVWDVATSRDAGGWTAEFRIPFSQLRFARAAQHRFGFNAYRVINRLNELALWQPIPKDASGVVSRFGDLEGIEGIRPPRRLEILPYTVGRAARLIPEAGNPFRTGAEHGAAAGADLKFGVTSNLTVDATINPDFGQVEADPAVVNLSAFETFFPERRPFFTEGISIFRFPIALGDGDGANEQLFYSRRIGREPQGEADPRGGFAETVRRTRILGAGKLSGKTPSGWTIGLMGAATAEETAEVQDSAGAAHRDVVEPQSGYFVGRLARDFRNGRTVVGLFGTALTRDLPHNLDEVRHSAYAGGLDLRHRFRGDTYELRGWAVGSTVRGSTTAITLTQRSSARYFQRPDNDYEEVDSAATSLSGLAAQMIFAKIAGGHWRFATGFDTRSPGFEVNDVGFMRDADRTIQFAFVGYRWFTPGRVFRRVNVNLNQFSAWDYGWDRLNAGGNVNGNFVLANYWEGYLGINRQVGGLSTGALRGGPALRTQPALYGWLGFFSDERKRLRIGMNGSFGREDESGGWSADLSPEISWRPSGRMDLSLSPSFGRTVDDSQYLMSGDALGSTHYLFGELHQRTLALRLRGSVTFAPTLTLQLYAEPFYSAGEYVEFKRVAEPRVERYADRFEVFGPDRLLERDGAVEVDLDRDGGGDLDLGTPDFSFASFRSNVVVRWEYRPGSTIFLVWQQNRSSFSSDGRYRFGDAARGVFRPRPENVFLVKVNYWLSL